MIAGQEHDPPHADVRQPREQRAGVGTKRVGEMLDFYGSQVMLLIGGALLEARERLTQETAAFVETVKGYEYG